MNAPNPAGIPPTPAALPHEDANFRHLLWDVVWFWLAAQALWRFLGVYGVRIGMSPLELGWLSSAPSVAFMLAASLGAWWRRKYRDSVRALFWPALLMRLKFLLPAFTPFFPPEWQPFWLISTATITSLPDGVSGVIFVVLLRESVGVDRLASLVSQRNIAINIGLAISAIVLGVWLKEAPFPANYQVMFAGSTFFALLSFVAVMRVRVPESVPPLPSQSSTVSPWRSPAFLRVALVLVLAYLPVFFLGAIYNLRLIDEMGADEIYMSLYALVELAAGAIISTRADRWIRRYGSAPAIAASMLGTAASVLPVTLSSNLGIGLGAALIGGASWSVAAIALFDYFARSTPAEDMTRYSTAYHQVVFLAVFIAPLLGSTLVSGGVSLVAVILLGGVLRLAGAGLISRVGRVTPQAAAAQPHVG